jgi:hypothetical protein
VRMNEFMGLLVVIPTRNRADLAIAAVESLLASASHDIRIVVSDNSTNQTEVERLVAKCADLGVERWRPPSPMAMATHWEWALDRGAADIGTSHVTFLTDRMVARDAAFRALIRIVKRFPDDVVSYGHDRLDDLTEPVRLEENQWSGRLLRVPSGLSARLVADSNELVNMTLPRLLNCVVPKPTVRAIQRKFGQACGGTVSPDFAFAFRCLATVPTTIYYDRPVLIHYAMARSNGATIARGAESDDHSDFLANLSAPDPAHAAPIPELVTVHNAVIHEYCLVRSQGTAWPSVTWPRYVTALAAEVAVMDEGPTKKRALAILEPHLEAAVGSNRATPRRIGPFLKPARSPLVTLHQLLIDSARAAPIWRFVEGVSGLTAPLLAPVVRQWVNREAAMTHAFHAPRKPHPGISEFEFDVGLEYGRLMTRTLDVVRD